MIADTKYAPSDTTMPGAPGAADAKNGSGSTAAGPSCCAVWLLFPMAGNCMVKIRPGREELERKRDALAFMPIGVCVSGRPAAKAATNGPPGPCVGPGPIKGEAMRGEPEAASAMMPLREQVVSPALEKVPRGQRRHESEPDALEKKPGAHGMHLAAIVALEKKPGAHGVHADCAVAAIAAEKEPAPQGVHAVAFALEDQEPAGQSEQVDEPLSAA